MHKTKFKKEIADYTIGKKGNSVGTLYDDLLRRDFTINSIAYDVDTGELIDIVNGVNDIHSKTLRTTYNVNQCLMDDPLRILRGLRFNVCLGFELDQVFIQEIKNELIWDKFSQVVRVERIREELNKMFNHDTITTLNTIMELKTINENAYNTLFGKINLKPMIRY